ncbi:MAG: hypothetical protein J7L34_01865 [Thermotogaceae bacterium]|nr:hypothetical protein [Thermotogaceae bacterium]
MVEVSPYRDGVVILVNDQNKVFLEFKNEEENFYRKVLLFHGVATDMTVLGNNIFVVGSTLNSGVLYVADITGVLAFRHFDDLKNILQVVASSSGVVVVGRKKSGYALLFTDFYGHIAWKRYLSERSKFIKIILNENLYIAFDSSIYTVDLGGNIISKEIFKNISTIFLKGGYLYVIFNYNGISYEQSGKLFIEDLVEDACVFKDDVYAIGSSGVWKNKLLLIRGIFKGLICSEDNVIVWTNGNYLILPEDRK